VRTWWFWVLIAVVAVLAICASAVLADWLLYYNEVHAGVSVHGVDLGGMTQDQAEAAVSRLVDNAGPIILNSGDKSWFVRPATWAERWTFGAPSQRPWRCRARVTSSMMW